MPRQVYRCPDHGEFEVSIRVKIKVPEVQPCPAFMPLARKTCLKQCPWVPSAPNFIGGPTTGAKKGE